MVGSDLKQVMVSQFDTSVRYPATISADKAADTLAPI